MINWLSITNTNKMIIVIHTMLNTDRSITNNKMFVVYASSTYTVVNQINGVYHNVY